MGVYILRFGMTDNQTPRGVESGRKQTRFGETKRGLLCMMTVDQIKRLFFANQGEGGGKPTMVVGWRWPLWMDVWNIPGHNPSHNDRNENTKVGGKNLISSSVRKIKKTYLLKFLPQRSRCLW